MSMTMRFALIALLAVSASAQPARRALLIGIDDYTASSLPTVSATRQHPGWPDLRGSANDVRILTDMLILRYGFERKNIVTLTNSDWRPNLIVGLLLAGYLAWSTRHWLRRIVDAIPEYRAALIGFAILAFLGYALNDSGIAIPAVMFTVLTATLSWLVMSDAVQRDALEEDRTDRPDDPAEREPSTPELHATT